MLGTNQHNWLNDTARDLNGKIYKHRKSQPPVATRAKWRNEYLESGAQYRMSWTDFCRGKTKQWNEQRELENWTFGTGRFKGSKISSVIKNNITYITYILENQPKGKTAKQIIQFITRNPKILNKVKSKI